MSKPRKDEPLKTPIYKGGMVALKKFISENLVYPKEALNERIEGDVEVAYDVDGLGRILNIKVLSGLGYGCDNEVVRLINSLVYQKAINKGKNTLTHKKLKINFKLPARPKTNALNLNYQIKTEPPQGSKALQPKTVFNYTISVNKKN
ncbi:MAG: TonB family protein [Roseivirga sp.]|jgi:TonB family protein